MRKIFPNPKILLCNRDCPFVCMGWVYSVTPYSRKTFLFRTFTKTMKYSDFLLSSVRFGNFKTTYYLNSSTTVGTADHRCEPEYSLSVTFR